MVISAKDREVLDGLLAEAEGVGSPVLFLLHKIQEKWGHISWEIANYICAELDIPMTQIYSAVTFYEAFTLSSEGKHLVRVCRGVVCHGKGSMRLLEGIKKHFRVEEDGTTDDGIFTLVESSCIGQCDGAPSMMLDGEVHRNLDLNMAIEILEGLRKRGE